MENNQKCALVTGATSGIGLELARLFAKDQFNLIIVARNSQELDQTARELSETGIDVIPIACDLSKMDEVQGLCNDIEQRGLQVHVLVNDAGQGLYGLFKDTELAKELDIVHLNICATIILTKHFVKKKAVSSTLHQSPAAHLGHGNQYIMVLKPLFYHLVRLSVKN
jgi:short-subunit dehydrogenase